jgi:penicillin-binding protein 2
VDSRVRIKDHWNEQRLFSQRTLGAFVVIALLVLGLIGRLVFLQVVRHGYYVELSQGNRVRLDPIPASRGLILDRNGKVMADSEPAYQLELIREQVPDLNDTIRRLAALNLVDPDEIEDTRRMILSRRSFDNVPVRLRLTDEEIGRFAVHRFQFPGVDLATRQTRHYPYGELAVHALGYVSAISEQDLEHIDRASYEGTTLIGKLGIESSYERQLHGKNGFREILVNAQGRSVQRQGAYAPELHSQAPVAGDDLVLALDLTTQQVAEEALGAHRGAVVAIDPNNGDVLALASKPGFDPATFARGLTRSEYAALADDIDKPLFNRALRGTYPSGSTIKPVIALAAMTYHVVEPSRQEFCAGVFHLPGSAHLYREGKGGKHGYVGLERAIAVSCDVYFYGLASTVGVDRIDSMMAPFGYGALTGIDISGEKPGLLPSPEWKRKTFKRPQDQVWFPGETVNLGIGQGYLLVTPLQLAHVASVLAERGRSFRPRLLTGIRKLGGQLQIVAPVQLPSVTGISDDAWDLVLRGMVGAATYGTAAAISKGASYPIAGKTGTAEVFTVGQNEKYVEKNVAERLRDHAWFIAFAPVDAPRIAVAVLVENGGFGASAAAPIARKVMDAYLLQQDTSKQPDAATPESEASD